MHELFELTWANALDWIWPNGMDNNPLESLEQKSEEHLHPSNPDSTIVHLK